MKFFRRCLLMTSIIWILGLGFFIFYVVSFADRYDASFDNVVVLTGGRNRIARAFESVDNYNPKSIFISGVYEKTTLKDILPQKHVENVQIVLGKQAKNTEENAREIDKWVKQNSISKILLITSDYHIPRSMMELKHVNSNLQIYPYAVKSDLNFRFIWLCIREFHRIILSLPRIVHVSR